MAITKTKFINYIRCPRYVALDDIKLNKLDSLVTFKEYKEEEHEHYLNEIFGNMFDEDGHDLIDIKDEQLEAMLPFYNEIEFLAGNIASKYFKGTFKYAYNTKEQESFDCVINGIRYICYTDIYNEVTNDSFNIIEVKATTTKKFLTLGTKEYSIFEKGLDGIYYLLEDLNVDIENTIGNDKYNQNKAKFFNRLNNVGHYIYDLAVQRYIIENDMKQNNIKKRVKYYLAVLNSNYIFDGNYEKGKAIYKTDCNGNEIISFFDLTSITSDYMDIIDIDRKRIESYIQNIDGSRYPIGEHCENKKSTKCKYTPICWNILPSKNSIMHYIDSHHGFKDFEGNKYNRYDLINNGVVNMLDVPKSYLNREKNQIQREVVETHLPYINKQKIKDGIAQLSYPIYHLDFETFPCPLPRYKGEKPYTQSVFQFSLHIEKEPGVCDKEKDHYGFLANDNNDQRASLIKEMLKYIDVYSKGTVLVYNESFEKTRLQELADIFLDYKLELLKLKDMVFDLMNITKTKSKMYEELGYSKEEATMFNYYHEDMMGSFSIKKILPLFSDLSYSEMDIGNGIDALVTYARFAKMDEKEFAHKYEKLIEYCKQDTWAMVEILKGLKKCVK